MSATNYRDEENTAFDKALSRFTFDLAGGGLICHLAGQGYSVKYIREQCDYPVSEEKVRQTVWDYYLESGIICLEDPNGASSHSDSEHPADPISGAATRTQTDYVMDIGPYGRRSFRQVVREDRRTRIYLPCDFGLLRSRNPAEYERRLARLDSRKRDYVEGLPWPDRIIFHESTLWIREILELWEEPADSETT